MKKPTGYVLVSIATLLTLFAIVMALLDVISAARINPSNPGSAGFQFGSVIGIFFRTLILGIIALLLFRKGRALLNPARYSTAALNANHLRGIYELEGLAARTFSDPKDDLDYAGETDAGLISIYQAINRQTVPDRFEALLSVIKIRVERMGQQPAETPSA